MSLSAIEHRARRLARRHNMSIAKDRRRWRTEWYGPRYWVLDDRNNVLNEDVKPDRLIEAVMMHIA